MIGEPKLISMRENHRKEKIIESVLINFRPTVYIMDRELLERYNGRDMTSPYQPMVYKSRMNILQ